MKKYSWNDWIFISYMIAGVLLGSTSTIFFINNLPLSGTCAIVMGLAFTIGAKIDWKRHKRRMNNT